MKVLHSICQQIWKTKQITAHRVAKSWTRLSDFTFTKLVLEKAEDQRPNCQYPPDHQKSKRVPEKIYFCFIGYANALTVWITMNWKILQEVGTPDHLICLLRNLYANQQTKVRTERVNS